MMSDSSHFPPFKAPYAADDCVIAARLLETAKLSAAQDARWPGSAPALLDAIRASDDRLGGVEDMLREFAVFKQAGLVQVGLAQALQCVPDARTADQFI